MEKWNMFQSPPTCQWFSPHSASYVTPICEPWCWNSYLHLLGHIDMGFLGGSIFQHHGSHLWDVNTVASIHTDCHHKGRSRLVRPSFDKVWSTNQPWSMEHHHLLMRKLTISTGPWLQFRKLYNSHYQRVNLHFPIFQWFSMVFLEFSSSFPLVFIIVGTVGTCLAAHLGRGRSRKFFRWRRVGAFLAHLEQGGKSCRGFPGGFYKVVPHSSLFTLSWWVYKSNYSRVD